MVAIQLQGVPAVNNHIAIGVAASNYLDPTPALPKHNGHPRSSSQSPSWNVGVFAGLRPDVWLESWPLSSEERLL